MEAKTTTSLYGERGAGGKFRKTPARKPPSTPYDRPPPAAKSHGWLSKFVDPACRLLAGGATKILPSLFSKPLSSATASPLPNSDNSNNRDFVVAPTKKDDGRCASSHAVFTSFEGTGPSEVPDTLKRNSEFDELGKGKVKNSSENNEISRIEQLIKGKTFSTNEINHLTYILKSRNLDISEVEQETLETLTTAAGENEGILLTHKGEQEDNNKAILRTPFPPSNLGDEIGASPIEIARTYMGHRKLERGPDPYSDLSKAEGTMQLIEFSPKPLIPSASPKASPCWPGAIVPDQHGYLSPQSQRDRFGLHDFPRTPYSRTIYSKSRAKAKTRDDVLHDGYGSVGPIRRVRNKFASEVRSRGSIFSKPLKHSASLVETPNLSNGFLPTVEKNLKPGETSNSSKYQPADSGARLSEEGNLVLNPSTSQAVRRILEHLDRNKPTPKEKAAELKLVTAWRKPASSEIPDHLAKATSSLSSVGDFKKSDLVSEGKNDRKKSDVPVRSPDIIINEAENAVDARATVSSLDGDSGMNNRASAGSSSGLMSISDFQVKSSHEKAFVGTNNGQKEINEPWPLHDQSNGQNLTSVPNAGGFEQLKKPAIQSTGTKPILPSIGISKPDPGRVLSSDNGLGFTFPVSASLGVLSEPPTPSIMPSSSASMLPLPTQVSIVPSYSFGAEESSRRLVFSFPATSSASTDSDTSELKFKFGSDKSTSLSFKSVGKGAACY